MRAHSFALGARERHVVPRGTARVEHPPADGTRSYADAPGTRAVLVDPIGATDAASVSSSFACVFERVTRAGGPSASVRPTSSR